MLDDMSMKQILVEPQNIDDLHITHSIVIDIMFRLLFNEGNVALSRFVEVMKISSRIIDEVTLWMQKEHLIEVSKASSELGRLGYVYTLSDAGRQRARDALERSLYVGPVPVAINFYQRGLELQTMERRRVTPAQVKEALASLVLPSNFHRHIGPALISGTSLFLYGPPGNGKTTIAQAIGKLISGTDPIWLPYALTSGGQIIQVYDRITHKPPPTNGVRAEGMGRIDQRWSFFTRPSVMVGGELKMEALDLRFDPVAKIYEAPLQLKANGGMLLIDDFGRQQVKPSDLLNRWIVPLEEKVDILRLLSGQTIVVPFRMLTIFSTNLDPYELVDDAFLRRIQIKVEVSPPDEKLFFQIFVMMCKEYNIQFNKESFVHFIHTWYRQNGRVMQAVHPRDILRTITSLCEYDDTPPRLSPDIIDEACLNYFVR